MLLHFVNAKVNWEKNRESVEMEEKKEIIKYWIRESYIRESYYKTTQVVIIYT